MRLFLLAPFALAACAAGPHGGPGPSQFSGEAEGRLGEVIRLHDLSLTPLEVVEDSRCPAEVMCVHAGFFRVRVEIRSGSEVRTEVMELGRGIALEDARRLALSQVQPRREGPATAPADYRLTFTLGPGD